MISIIQRVTTAKVTVNDQDIGKIDAGIMALVAVEKEDTQKNASGYYGKFGQDSSRDISCRNSLCQ